MTCSRWSGKHVPIDSRVGRDATLSSKHLQEGARNSRRPDSISDTPARLGIAGRVRGSGRIALTLVLPVWLTALALVLAVPPTSFTPFDALARWIWLAACVWFIVRSLFVGAYVTALSVVIVGWFGIYRIRRTEIDGFTTRAYIALITRGSDQNLFTSRVRSLGIDIAFDRVRFFNSIAMPNRIARRVVSDLERFALEQPEKLHND